MKKLISLILLLLLFAYVSTVNTFAWWGSSLFSDMNSKSSKNNQLTFDTIEKRLVELRRTAIDNNAKKIVDQTKNIENKQKVLVGNKTPKNIEKLKIGSRSNKLLEQVKKDGKIMSVISEIANKPATTNNDEKTVIKTIVTDRLQSLSTQVVNNLSTGLIIKLGGANNIKDFKLSDKFDPNKVVTFDDIKTLYISNFTLYQNLLGCEDPDDAVKNLCGNIANLLEYLTGSNKKLTINDVYRLQVYANTIAQAIFYEGTLSEFKKGAVVFGIDRKSNLLKSVDIVRDYTVYDTANNDVLPVIAKEVDIDVLNQTPKAEGSDVKIVLGLNGGSVVGLRLYPVDNSLYMPYAKTYKVMTIKGLKKGCEDKKYEYSIWYGYNKIGISKTGENLQPKGTKGIKFNFDEKCYDTFNN